MLQDFIEYLTAWTCGNCNLFDIVNLNLEKALAL